MRLWVSTVGLSEQLVAYRVNDETGFRKSRMWRKKENKLSAPDLAISEQSVRTGAL